MHKVLRTGAGETGPLSGIACCAVCARGGGGRQLGIDASKKAEMLTHSHPPPPTRRAQEFRKADEL